MQKRLIADKLAGPRDGIAVAAGLGLGDEFEPGGRRAGRLAEGRLVAGANHDRHLVGSGRDSLFHNDLERRLLRAVAIHEPLERQVAVIAAGGGDDGAGDFHG